MRGGIVALVGFLILAVIHYALLSYGVPDESEVVGEYEIVCGSNGIVLTLDSAGLWKAVLLSHTWDTLAQDNGSWLLEVVPLNRSRTRKRVYVTLHRYATTGMKPYGTSFRHALVSTVAEIEIEKPLWGKVKLIDASALCPKRE